MIPTVNDLKSDVLRHKHGDIFNPPGLTNFLGCVQVDFDLLGIRSLNFPPYGCSDIITGGLYVNDRYFPALGLPVDFVWYPDRIERTCIFDGFEFHSVTVLPVNKTACLVSLKIKNVSGSKKKIDIKIGLTASVTKAVRPWNEPLPPMESEFEMQFDNERNAIIYKAKQSGAYQIQGVNGSGVEINRFGLKFSKSIEAGESADINYVNTIGEDISAVLADYNEIQSRASMMIDECRQYWSDELKAVYTPGNSRYSGSMPLLETTDKEVKKIYDMGILGVIYFKRDNPFSVIGRTYDTLMPKYWQTVTFIWDYELSSLTHALLDPSVARKYLLHWMAMDIHKHFGTEYLTGGPVGPWYSVNDFALTVIANDYLRWTGNFDWLKEKVKSNADENVLDYLVKYAENWKAFKSVNGLADYGGINNLLECVSTYIHEVASLNAGNIFNMRKVAEILRHTGQNAKADALLNDARGLVPELQKLYVDGKGYWNARFPDGELVEVRHCYDFITILNNISDDLSAKQKQEMISFFENELLSPTWLRALSPGDDNSIFSVRPDHQWNGAYPAWPAQAVTALFKGGRPDLAVKWLKGLAKSANQGPFGQAQFVETAIEPECGGARKAPPEMPYLTDWTVSSGGSWTNIIIESLFGVKASLFNGITAEPEFAGFDPKAELKNLNYQGRLFHVTAKGIVKA